MIVSRVIGGLGNQMFQYAAGRALSLERSQTLLLDVSGFAGYGLHQEFELQRVFNCPAEIAAKAGAGRDLFAHLLTCLLLSHICLVVVKVVNYH